MPHAVFVTSYLCPASTAQAIRIQSLAEAVAELPGWQLTLVAPARTDAGQPSIEQSLPNINLVYDDSKKTGKTNLLARGLGELNQTFRLLRLANKQKGDLLIVSIPSIFLLLSTAWPKPSHKIVDLRDLVWEYLVQSTGAKRWAGIILRHIALHLLKRATLVTTTNEQEARHIQKETNIQPLIIRNGVSKKRFTQLNKIPAPTYQGAPYHIVYIGNIGLAQELDTILDATKNERNIHVTLVGGGNDRPRLEQIKNNENMDNVTITGPLSWDETLPYLESADCLFGQIGSAYSTAIPSKIFEYACAGRPTIFSAPSDGAAWELLATFQHFTQIKPGDPEELKRVIAKKQREQLLTTDEAYHNRKIVEHNYLREEQSLKLAKFIQRVYDTAHKRN